MKQIKEISNNEKGVTKKRNNQIEYSLKNEGVYKESTRNKYSIYETEKYSLLEKKILEEMDYMNFLMNNRTIGRETYKEIIRKKYVVRLVLPLLSFLLLLTSLMLDLYGNCGIINWLLNLSYIEFSYRWAESVKNFISRYHLERLIRTVCMMTNDAMMNYVLRNLFGTLIYLISFFILGGRLISSFFYFNKKVKKYENILFR
ncbi:fam-l protein [Plasmodium malariae]|uniref:Fam-l protein n=1 Tax=Plasmodium malariae TaxID=5858 RepID=A0A1D3JLA3_PLAMA|nr:fam-l protein [Plasmodium malariae]SBT87285.1 fam-l protein [Plasmodium malariae]